MDDMRKPQGSKERQPVEPQRRPWHAPQFFVAGLASTLATQQANSDGTSHNPPGTLS
jgi:hypothetical protein